MIVEMTGEDFASLLRGRAPRSFALPDTPLEREDVLRMLADLAATIGAHFAPACWLIVEANEVAGLCSIVRPPHDGIIAIGYGVTSARRGRGVAGRALHDLVDWGRRDDRVRALAAETTHTNIASQRVLIRNGFARTGECVDEEDGPLICWRHSLN